MAIGRYRGFGGAHIQRFRAAQRINIPRSFGRQRMPMVRNTTIFLGGGYQGGHHCCCGGRVQQFLAGAATFIGVFGGLLGAFRRDNRVQENPEEDYKAGQEEAQKPAATEEETDTKIITELKNMLNEQKNEIAELKQLIKEKKDDGLGGKEKKEDEKSDFEKAAELCQNGDDKETAYSNYYNNSTGFTYKNKIVSYTGQNVGQMTSFSAFLTNNNKDSSIEITSKNNTTSNWKSAFNNILTDSGKSSMDETEFMNWFTAYTNNAQAEAKDKNTARKKTDTVDLDECDKKYLKALFNTIAGDDKKLSKDEFSDFMTKLFNSTYVTKTNDGKLKLTRFKLDRYIIKNYIKQNE